MITCIFLLYAFFRSKYSITKSLQSDMAIYVFQHLMLWNSVPSWNYGDGQLTSCGWLEFWLHPKARPIYLGFDTLNDLLALRHCAFYCVRGIQKKGLPWIILPFAQRTCTKWQLQMLCCSILLKQWRSALWLLWATSRRVSKWSSNGSPSYPELLCVLAVAPVNNSPPSSAIMNFNYHGTGSNHYTGSNTFPTYS